MPNISFHFRGKGVPYSLRIVAALFGVSYLMHVVVDDCPPIMIPGGSSVDMALAEGTHTIRAWVLNPILKSNQPPMFGQTSIPNQALSSGQSPIPNQPPSPNQAGSTWAVASQIDIKPSASYEIDYSMLVTPADGRLTIRELPVDRYRLNANGIRVEDKRAITVTKVTGIGADVGNWPNAETENRGAMQNRPNAATDSMPKNGNFTSFLSAIGLSAASDDDMRANGNRAGRAPHATPSRRAGVAMECIIIGAIALGVFLPFVLPFDMANSQPSSQTSPSITYVEAPFTVTAFSDTGDVNCQTTIESFRIESVKNNSAGELILTCEMKGTVAGGSRVELDIKCYDAADFRVGTAHISFPVTANEPFKVRDAIGVPESTVRIELVTD